MKKPINAYYASLSNFQTMPDNPNEGTERGQYMIEASLEKFGFGRSILSAKDDVLIAGNHVFEVVGQKFGNDVIVVEIDGEIPVIVKRTDLESNSPLAKGLAVMDNRASEVGLNWSPEVLAQYHEEGVPLDDMFHEIELKMLSHDFKIPELETLENEYVDTEKTWPVIRACVSPEIYEIYERITEGETHDERITFLIQAINNL